MVRKRSNLAILLLLANFLKNDMITFILFLVYSFLGMLFINCQEMDLIELFKRSFSRSQRQV